MTARFIDLRTKKPTDRITLRGVNVQATLAGMTCRTVVEQLFVNNENTAVEAVYTFPLPEDGAVCAFEVVVGDRVLTGQVDDREQAIETYETAIDQGDGAFLLEQERPDDGIAARWALRMIQSLEIDADDEPIWRAAYEKALRYLAKATRRKASEIDRDLGTALVNGS